MSFRVSEATRNLITTKPEFCHSEHRRCEESLLLYKHKLFLRCAGVTFGAKSNQNVGDGVDRRQWRMKGDGERENNEQTRGASARRSMRRLFFRAIYGCDSPAPHKRHTSVECYVCYKSRNSPLVHYIHSPKNSVVIFVKIFQPAKALEIFLLSADFAIYIRGKAPNPFLFAKSQFIKQYYKYQFIMLSKIKERL